MHRLDGPFTWRYADMRFDSNASSSSRRIAMTDIRREIPAFNQSDGLITAVAQDVATGNVLMVAHMNLDAWLETIDTGRAVYYSRSRGRLWRKGEQSGNFQQVRELFVDCDGDAVLLKVEQVGGAACHEGYPSCFFRQITSNGLQVVAERVFDPQEVYRREDA
jgi:phosphoribosyl-AMP cyclohydrolase